MHKIRVNLKKSRNDSYEIEVESGLFARSAHRFRKIDDRISEWVIICDENVAAIYGKKFLRQMQKAPLKAHLVTFPAGERSKSRKVLSKIEDSLFDLGIGRDGGIVALGGGVTGDIAGFIAATYMRGIPFVQVPTTLLAMVDSSVGGKTGIDVPAGKNLIGAFYQPKAALIDPELLKTLPAGEIQNGMAEVVKHAMIADAGLFQTLEKHADALYALDSKLMEPIIALSCAIKVRIVEMDERESGLRQVLNYGHTVGHAIERLSRYRFPHGRAVALGMAVEGLIARNMGFLKDEELERQNALLKRLKFKLAIPKRWSAEEIIAAMRSDKKVRSGEIRMALPAKIGKMMKPGKNSWTLSPPVRIIANALGEASQRS